MKTVSNSELFNCSLQNLQTDQGLGELVTIHKIRPKDKEDRSEETIASF